MKAEMSGWGLAFSQRLMNVSSRIAPQEKIYQKGGAEVSIFIQWLFILQENLCFLHMLNSMFLSIKLMYRAEDADWSRDMRGKQLITPVNLENWVIVFTRRNSAQAQDLVQNLSRVGPPMGMRINSPTMWVFSI